MEIGMDNHYNRTGAHTGPLATITVLAAALLSACGSGDAPSAGAAQATQLAALVQVSSTASLAQAAAVSTLAPLLAQANGEGSALTVTASGSIDTANPFFKALGNGRACATCHQQAEGWSMTPAGLRARFDASAGSDPVFRAIDGANSPLAATVTLDQKRAAYSMLLTHGVIRVGIAVPANAEFTLARADDPYHFASAAELSLFRRPAPTANLAFATSVMWDGRETGLDAASRLCIAGARPAQCYASVDTDLLHQANSAVRGHAEAAADLSAADQRAIVAFETGLFSAQSSSREAGNLSDAGALGGPLALSQQAFHFGINDVQAGDYLTGAPFQRNAMAMFGAWRNLANPPPPPPPPVRGQAAPTPPAPVSAQDLARASVARGEQLFNTRPFNITGVAGFDELRTPTRGTCTSCHSTPNVGTHSVPRLFNTGVADASLRTADQPLYTLRNRLTGELVETTDPGAALVTGKWSDIGKVKTPSLRSMAARAPYFHNGAAADLADVVAFYDKRFRIGLTPREAADLTAFLKVL
jgi:cytochrome c peroxidase